MNKDTLNSILSKLTGAKTSRKDYAFEETQRVSLLISTGGEPLTIESIKTLAFGDGFVSIDTTKAEQYHFDLERVIGISCKNLERRSAGAGFIGGDKR